jgi:Dihydrodipicolinate reductase
MTKIAIIGYGNLGRGVERSLKQNPDLELVGVFTRRSPESVTTEGAKAYTMQELESFKDQIDVCILCGGSCNRFTSTNT